MADASAPARVALGHAEADATLQGGLALAAVHEVFAEGRQSAAATGFIAGLAGRERVTCGAAAAGLGAAGFCRDRIRRAVDGGPCRTRPRSALLVTVRAADVDTALRTAADALACDALGAVVLEVWGEARQFDLVASRKLTLAAQASGVTGLLLRVAAQPQPSTAETRWIVRAAHSPPASAGSAWGAPVFDAQLVRNRHGPVGRWIMEWKCDECLFAKPAAYPQPVAAAPAHRPHQAQLRSGSAAPDSNDNEPSIVVAKQNNALQIFALDDAAAHLGLSIGLPLANARAICPELTVFDADEAADAKTLSDIADWCDRFTPLVALDPPHGLFLDITGCAHLFGGEAALMQMVCGALTRQGFAVSAAIAGTSVCARTMTRHVSGRIVADGEEAEAVEPLPVFALGADDAITRGLRRAGLKTIGDVASRARHEITARFGDGFTTLLEQALGQGDAPISPRKPLPDYIVEKRFPEPVATDRRDLGDLVRARRNAGRGDGPAGQGRAAAGSEFLPHRRRGARDRGRYRATRDQGRGDRPAVSRAARCA